MDIIDKILKDTTNDVDTIDENLKTATNIINNHVNNKNNPHNVTASEIGARPNTWTPTASEVGAQPANSNLTEYKNGVLTTIDGREVKISSIEISPNEPTDGDVWIDTDDEGEITDSVTSVNGKSGDVTLTAKDVNAYSTTETDNLLKNKSNENHKHTADQITDLNPYINALGFGKTITGTVVGTEKLHYFYDSNVKETEIAGYIESGNFTGQYIEFPFEPTCVIVLKSGDIFTATQNSRMIGMRGWTKSTNTTSPTYYTYEAYLVGKYLAFAYLQCDADGAKLNTDGDTLCWIAFM